MEGGAFRCTGQEATIDGAGLKTLSLASLPVPHTWEMNTPKLKLTLKLSSSSLSSTPSSAPGSQPPSAPASSVLGSPVKNAADEKKHAVAETRQDTPTTTNTRHKRKAPSSATNGRGRPKKGDQDGAVATGVDTVVPVEGDKQPVSTTAEAFDLRAFVQSMQSFRPRAWTLTRNLRMDTVFPRHQLQLPALWITTGVEPASLHLKCASTVNAETNRSTLSDATGPAPFSVTCHCGKTFTDRGKFRKHIKTHEDKRTKLVNEAISIPSASAPIAPIALKLRLKPPTPLTN